MEPFLARGIGKAYLPRAGLSLGRDKDGAFGRTLHSINKKVMGLNTY